MPGILPVTTILQIADISQYLADTDLSNKNSFQGGAINNRTARVIYLEKKSLRNRYTLNPSDPTLVDVANYVFALCGPYSITAQNILSQLSQSKPVVTGPSNQSVLVGATATFSVSVTSSLSYVTQWYLNGVLIPGATGNSYQVTNAQLSQSGGIYSAVVTNGAGSTLSASATLTVSVSEVGYYYYGNTDYSTQLQSNIDNVPYQGTFNITTGQPLSVQFPSGAAGPLYIVVKYPATETVKTTYANAPINNGNIPSIAFASIVTFGGWRYIFPRTGNPFGQNTANPVIFT